MINVIKLIKQSNKERIEKTVKLRNSSLTVFSSCFCVPQKDRLLSANKRDIVNKRLCYTIQKTYG